MDVGISVVGTHAADGVGGGGAGLGGAPPVPTHVARLAALRPRVHEIAALALADHVVRHVARHFVTSHVTS